MTSQTSNSVDRRRCLQAGGIALAASTMGTPLLENAALPAQDRTSSGWIDAHSHIWTRDVKKFPLAKGQTVADLDPPSFTSEELIQTAAAENVQRAVLIQHHIYHGWDNRYLIHAAERYPGKFKVVGMVDDTEPNPAETMRRLQKRHVSAFRITAWIRGSDKWLDGPGMDAMWKCGADTNQAMCCLIDPRDLSAVDRMCQKHPDTPVVIDHFARIGVDGQIRQADVKQLCALARHQQVYVKVSAYYALGKKQPPYLDLVPMIQQVYEAYGPQRLMWASDSPYQLVDQHTYRASIHLIREGIDFLSSEDRDWLLRKTAEKVYFYKS